VHDRRRLTVYFKRSGTLWKEPAASWDGVYLIISIVAVVVVVVAAGGGGVVYYVRVVADKDKDEEGEAVIPAAAVRQRTHGSVSSVRRGLRPPADYRGDRW